MRIAPLFALPLLGLVSFAGCKKDDPPKAKEESASKDDKSEKKESEKKKKNDDDKPAGKTKDDDDKADEKAEKADEKTEKADEPEVDEKATEEAKKDPKNNDDFGDGQPGPRTATPTVAEWNAAGDVDVDGKDKVHCETRMVREWLRVSCRGKNDSGGAPTAVSITKGKTTDTLTYVNKGVTSLIVPFEPGMKAFEAIYAWEDKSVVLTVKWPAGAKRPSPVGAFDTAKTLPGVPIDEALAGRLCECFKKLTTHPTCNDLLGAPDVDCDRTYSGDCEKLVECSRYEPGAAPKCLAGWVNGGVAGHCFKKCSSNADCSAKEECNDEMSYGQGTICNPTE